MQSDNLKALMKENGFYIYDNKHILSGDAYNVGNENFKRYTKPSWLENTAARLTRVLGLEVPYVTRDTETQQLHLNFYKVTRHIGSVDVMDQNGGIVFRRDVASRRYGFIKSTKAYEQTEKDILKARTTTEKSSQPVQQPAQASKDGKIQPLKALRA